MAKGNKKGVHFMHLTESDREDIRRMTLAGKSAAEIAEWIGCCDETVRRNKRVMGFGKEHYGKRYWKTSDYNTLVDLYNAGAPYTTIASKLNRTREAINMAVVRLISLGRLVPRRGNKLLKNAVVVALSLFIVGCRPYKVSDKYIGPKVDTVYHGHYMTYAGRTYSVEHADIMCKYVHDEQMCENIPGTSCYKRKYHGKFESNR